MEGIDFYKDVADDPFFVFFAYILTFGAWSLVSTNDFISTAWETIGKTRRHGQFHFFVVLGPMLYMTAYIYFQFMARDYKETGAALIALYFALLHAFRTMWGLWQLHTFKHWFIASVKTMESLGYRSTIRDVKNAPRGALKGCLFFWKARMTEDHLELLEMVDDVLVNDTIVENRLSEGEVRCSLKLLTQAEVELVRNTPGIIFKCEKAFRFAFANVLRGFRIPFLLMFSSTEGFSTRHYAPYMEPKLPEQVWLRWAAAFVSQAFPNWLQDISKFCSSEQQQGENHYETRREQFVDEVLLSAGMHSETSFEHAKKHKSRTSSSPDGNNACDMCTGVARHGITNFKMENLRHLWNGKFSKQELLERACKTGDGLPFGAPHRRAVVAKGYKEVYSYSLFTSKLRRAREMLPADEGIKAASLHVSQLEWLAIFLSVPRWSTVPEACQHCIAELEKTDPTPVNDISVTNLANQLGFESTSESFSLKFSMPLLKHTLVSSAVWGNRNILQVSAHIDNWLALCSGRQMKFVEKIINQTIVEPIDNNFEQARTAEQRRLLCQTADMNPENRYFDQTMTFMGCSMESLRSALADSVHAGANICWETPYKDDCKIETSKAFSEWLNGEKAQAGWHKRYAQMRLIWELQCALHRNLLDEGARPEKVEAMALCILSFPSIIVGVQNGSQTHISVEESNQEDLDEDSHLQELWHNIRDYRITIRVPHGPQKIQILLLFSKENEKMYFNLTLCEYARGENSNFKWESWRDAFYGGLEGTRSWQHEQDFSYKPPKIRTSHCSISEGTFEIETSETGTGKNISTWKGFPPFRASICIYELKTKEFILRRKEFVFDPARKCYQVLHQPRPVSYDRADLKALKHASVIAHEYLSNSSADHHRNVNLFLRAKNAKDEDIQMLLYEISALDKGHMDSLEKVVSNAVSQPNFTVDSEKIEQVVSLIDNFYSPMTGSKGANIRAKNFKSASWIRRMEKLYFDELMTKTMYAPEVASSYATFRLAVSAFSGGKVQDLGKQEILRSVARNGHFPEKSFSCIELLQGTLDTKEPFEFQLCTAMYESFIRLSAKRESLREDSAQAENLLGTLYKNGAKNIPKDKARAKRLYWNAVDKGSISARRNFAQFEEPAEKRRHLEIAVKKGDIEAMYLLGQLLESGAEGVEKDAPRALTLYNQAVSTVDHMKSKKALVELLRRGGDGIECDKERADKLLSEIDPEAGRWWNSRSPTMRGRQTTWRFFEMPVSPFELF